MGISVFPAAGGGVTQKAQEFTSTGTFTVPSNCSSVQVILVGGGGGAGYSQSSGTAVIPNAGGGGGEYINTVIPVTPGSSYTVTVGGGGAAAASVATASNGSNTTFGSLAIAYGGGGAASWSQNTGTAAMAARGGGGFNDATGQNAGCGGGAGGNATSMTSTLSSWQYYSNTNQTYSQTRVGGMGTPNTNMAAGGWHQAGPGINGFGNGGAGGFTNTTTSFSTARGINAWTGTGQPGIWSTSPAQLVNAVAPTANTGDGGQGTCTTNAGAGTAASGTAGASGYAKVIYWS